MARCLDSGELELERPSRVPHSEWWHRFLRFINGLHFEHFC